MADATDQTQAVVDPKEETMNLIFSLVFVTMFGHCGFESGLAQYPCTRILGRGTPMICFADGPDRKSGECHAAIPAPIPKELQWPTGLSRVGN